MSPEMRPKSLVIFEKRAPGPSSSKHSWREPALITLETYGFRYFLTNDQR